MRLAFLLLGAVAIIASPLPEDQSVSCRICSTTTKQKSKYINVTSNRSAIQLSYMVNTVNIPVMDVMGRKNTMTP
jgi:hypothetical protein